MTENPLLNAEIISAFLVFCALIASTVFGIRKWLVGMIETALVPERAEARAISHKLNNQVARIDALELSKENHRERLVKMETLVESIGKAVERIEHKLDSALNP